MSYRLFETMIEYDFTLRTKYSFFLYAQNKNYPIKLLKPKSFLSSQLKKKKKNSTYRGLGSLMVVGDVYDGGGGLLDSSFSLLQILCQFHVFYFGDSETMSFI